jgi:hypothetical protein
MRQPQSRGKPKPEVRKLRNSKRKYKGGRPSYASWKKRPARKRRCVVLGRFGSYQ